MIAAPDGIGHFIILSETSFQIADMWSGILMLGVLAYIVNTLFLFAEGRLLGWFRGARASSLGHTPAPRGSRRAKPARKEALGVG
jgi:hypothetical protein